MHLQFFANMKGPLSENYALGKDGRAQVPFALSCWQNGCLREPCLDNERKDIKDEHENRQHEERQGDL